LTQKSSTDAIQVSTALPCLLLRSRPRQRQGVDALRRATAGGAAERRAERTALQRAFDLLQVVVGGNA